MATIYPPIRETPNEGPDLSEIRTADHREGINETTWMLDRMENEYILGQVGFKPRLTLDRAKATLFYSFLPLLLCGLCP